MSETGIWFKHYYIELTTAYASKIDCYLLLNHCSIAIQSSNVSRRGYGGMFDALLNTIIVLKKKTKIFMMKLKWYKLFTNLTIQISKKWYD